MLINFSEPLPLKLNRKTVKFNATLTANAGATVVGRIPLDVGTYVYARMLVKMAAGDVRQLSMTCDASADTATAVAHGFVTGSPVYVGGTANPAGLTANTIYYVNAVDVDTLKFYDTKAHAVSGGATGLVDITTAGTAPLLIGTVEQAFYDVTGVVRNRKGVVSLLGTPVQNAVLEDVAAWNANITADDTNDAASFTLTPDATLDTRYDVVVEYFTDSNAY